MLGSVVLVVGAAVGCSEYAGEERVDSPDRRLEPDAGDAGAPRCGDPGSQCVVVPSGWIAVSTSPLVAPASADAGAPSCPPYFADGRTLHRKPRSAVETCTCTCGGAPTESSCIYGGVFAGTGVGGACTAGEEPIDTDGLCHPVSAAWSPTNVALQGAAPPPRMTSCSGASAVTPPIADDEGLTVCTSPAPSPCPEGACVAAPTKLVMCLLRDGDEACPPSFPSKTRYGTPASISDTRSCGTCTCQAQAQSCTDRTVTFYADNSCTMFPTAVSLDGKCNTNSLIGARGFYRYGATEVDATCKPSTATAPLGPGTLTVEETHTLCCR